MNAMSTNNGNVGTQMDNEKFHMLLGVLKILEKHEDPKVVESALEIIENYNEVMTSEQKAHVLKEVLHFKNNAVEEDRERRFQDEWKRLQMRELFKHEYY